MTARLHIDFSNQILLKCSQAVKLYGISAAYNFTEAKEKQKFFEYFQ